MGFLSKYSSQILGITRIVVSPLVVHTGDLARLRPKDEQARAKPTSQDNFARRSITHRGNGLALATVPQHFPPA